MIDKPRNTQAAATSRVVQSAPGARRGGVPVPAKVTDRQVRPVNTTMTAPGQTLRTPKVGAMTGDKVQRGVDRVRRGLIERQMV